MIQVVVVEARCPSCSRVVLRNSRRLADDQAAARWLRAWQALLGARPTCCGQRLAFEAGPDLDAAERSGDVWTIAIDLVPLAVRAEPIASPEAPSVPTVTTQGTETA